MRPTVLLFDIDGTLISTDGAGRRSFVRALTELTGRSDTCDFSFAGMTDRAIARRALEAAGQPVTDAAISAAVEAYVAILEEEIASAVCRVHPGVEAALDAAATARCAIGLGTGNVRAGARLKLGRVGLFERFAFGGFGCDAERRDGLLRVGAARGAALLGAALDDCRVVVIGDTPKDIAAAQAIGAESIAVATGQYPADALEACEPTWVFGDLAAKGAVEVLVG